LKVVGFAQIHKAMDLKPTNHVTPMQHKRTWLSESDQPRGLGHFRTTTAHKRTYATLSDPKWP